MTKEDFRSLRRAMDLSQRELAEQLGLSPINGHRTIRRIETGEYKITRVMELAMEWLHGQHLNKQMVGHLYT